MAEDRQHLLRRLPSISDLLGSETARRWLMEYPAPIVSSALRDAVGKWRETLLARAEIAPELIINQEMVLEAASEFLKASGSPRIRRAINATGIILHTGLGRAVFAESVVDSMQMELKGCCTMAVDPETGERAERDEIIEPLICELTGAEAATVVNNNAAATLLVLTGLASGREVIVSRGQLVEIGGSFRLPEVMAQSGARLVEVGATNRTHLKDYRSAITERTAALMRVHPSNYRIVGFTCEPALAELAELARAHGIPLIDDLGAGALVDLRDYGLPHEPTVRESLKAGADVALFSGDKLIGAGQAGIIVGKRELIQKLRRHPLMRALRVDKTCVMVLERTLRLFREPARLEREHPTYRMLATPMETLKVRAAGLAWMLKDVFPDGHVVVEPAQSFLGSGSLPVHAIPSIMVAVTAPGMSADRLSRAMRMDEACVFGRIESERVCLDMRTVRDDEIAEIASALKRAVAGQGASGSS